MSRTDVYSAILITIASTLATGTAAATGTPNMNRELQERALLEEMESAVAAKDAPAAARYEVVHRWLDMEETMKRHELHKGDWWRDRDEPKVDVDVYRALGAVRKVETLLPGWEVPRYFEARYLELLARGAEAADHYAALVDDAGADPRIHDLAGLGLAWLHYQGGRWELASVALGAVSRHDEEYWLLRALIAAATDDTDHLDTAKKALGGVEHRDYSGSATGVGVRETYYALRWVQAVYHLHRDEHAFALHALGEVNLARELLPCGWRYWTGIGHVLEECGETEMAASCYAKGQRHYPRAKFLRLSEYSAEPVVAGRPDRSLPYYTGTDGRYVCGSRLAHLTALCRDRAAGRRLDVGTEQILAEVAIYERSGGDPVVAGFLREHVQDAVGCPLLPTPAEGARVADARVRILAERERGACDFAASFIDSVITAGEACIGREVDALLVAAVSCFEAEERAAGCRAIEALRSAGIRARQREQARRAGPRIRGPR